MALHAKHLALSLLIVVLALVSSRFVPMRPFSHSRISEELSLRLQSFGITTSPTSIPTTFTARTPSSLNYLHIPPLGGRHTPDTTVVILNWSRLQNVILLSAAFCGPWLNDVVAELFIWNNNPNVTLTEKTFGESGCPGSKLRIFNSPTNELFKARYLACSQSRAPYCFTQDDDYLVQPEVIRNLHFYFSQDSAAHSIHLLPPHEHLLARLRIFTAQNGSLTTAFAWLGHGTYLRRSAAKDFLDLLRVLDVTDDEKKMADNYFTILANSPKMGEIWFDHGIELGGGQAFTVGTEGDDRNDRHIVRALEYLSKVVSNQSPSPHHPYVSWAAPFEHFRHVNVAPCRVASCLVTSNIPLLPAAANIDTQGTDLRSLTERKLHKVDETVRDRYIHSPFSDLVDARPNTVFRSPEVGRPGEWIIFDALRLLGNMNQTLELSLLIDKNVEEMFRDKISYSSSVDGMEWYGIKATVNCVEVDERNDDLLIECSVKVEKDARYFRAMISGQDSLHERWSVHEIWLRYLNSSRSHGVDYSHM